MNKTKRLRLSQLTFLLPGLIYSLLAIAQEEKQEIREVPTPPSLTSASQSYASFYSSQNLDFAIDLNSISIQSGAENEVRYVLKATSKQGAINVSYEGIRCDTCQKILYAIGHNDGSWKAVLSPKWKTIYKTGSSLPQTTLAYDFFCDGNALSGDEKSIRNRIKYNRPINALSH